MNEYVERIELIPGYSISRIIKGNWHLAGGHGSIDPDQAVEDMRRFVEAGITTFDCADIYTGVEQLIGRFIKKYGPSMRSGNLSNVQVHTKYVPDYDALSTLTRAQTEKIIDRSLKRLGVDTLDLVQFAWWDYRFKGYLDTADHLTELQKKGKIRHLGITNFDGRRTKGLVERGMPVISHQLQYSLLDHRPEKDLGSEADRFGFSYLCYGTLAGGFMSERFLDEKEPVGPYENRSLTKYKLIIDDFGGWSLFQELLSTLRNIADKHAVSISQVAIRYVLQKPNVAAVIVGARHARHLKSLRNVSQFVLDDEDLEKIGNVTAKATGPSGPVYDLERDKEGRHGRIMRYNLNVE